MSIGTMFAGSAALCAAESFALAALKQSSGVDLLARSELGLPKAYAGVVAVNAVGASFALISLGMKVGAARKKYKARAVA